MDAKSKVLGGRDSVKVAIVQRSAKWMNLDESVTRVCASIAEAAAAGAQLIAFPEVGLQGYPFWTQGWDSLLPQWVASRAIFHDNALVIPSPQFDKIAEAVRQAGVYVVLGTNELDARNGSQTVYNTLLFFDRQGKLMGRHRKLMPTFLERQFWGLGDADDIVTYDTDIGRISGLICGENLMTPVRAAVIAKGADIHIAAFPGSFSLTKGPRLQEADTTENNFWGYHTARSHAIEGGCFVLLAVGIQDPADIDPNFPYAGQMNTDWANGGSAVISPLAVPLPGADRTFGQTILYAELPSVLIKGVKSIVDGVGHYSRPDVVRVQVRENDKWQTVPEDPKETFQPQVTTEPDPNDALA